MFSPLRWLFFLLLLAHTIDAGGFKQTITDKTSRHHLDNKSQHILILVSKYLNIYDFHNFLLQNQRTFRSLRQYIEETGLIRDIQIFSGVDEPLFKDFSAYCASNYHFCSKKKIERSAKDIYVLAPFRCSYGLPYKTIEVYSNGLELRGILPGCNFFLHADFPLYSFVFEEKVFELSNFELVEHKDVLRVKYTNTNAYSRRNDMYASIDRSFKRLKQKSTDKLDVIFDDKDNKIKVTALRSHPFEIAQPWEEVVICSKKIYAVTKPIILNQNTCKNMFQRMQFEKKKNVKKIMQGCLPGIKAFIRK